MPRPKPTKYNAQQERFVRMEARGESRKDIMMEVFGIDIETASEKDIHNADCKMSRWRYFPCYEAVWKDEVRRVLYKCSGEAINTIKSQMRQEDGWLRNKAANDLLNYGKQQIYGDEEKTVHVQIEGMPDIGSPDDQ